MRCKHNTTHLLDGSLDLTRLPLALRHLSLAKNHFESSVDLTHLPPCLECLSLFANQISGKIDLTRLPPSMRSLHLFINQISGEVRVVPIEGCEIYLKCNNITSVVDIAGAPVVDENISV